MKKKCLHCKTEIQGRSDKKFCDDYCRNSYNNLRLRPTSNHMRNINNILRRNRQILYNFQSQKNVLREQLIAEGFVFKYITHIESPSSSSPTYWVYDMGLKHIDDDAYCINALPGPNIK